ncbi:hypothetical protein C8J57DRAFT_1735056 [Mycena rebaudengoi]|nr:hypothetical protein C8J57DRAFT_1735056 [Mycena rebaudengoi]
MSDLSGEEFDQLLQVIADSRLTGYFAGAALCVLIYDHIICSADEVELMWNSRWGLPKIIYFWNRYFSLIAVGLDTSVIVREIQTSRARRFYSRAPAPAHLMSRRELASSAIRSLLRMTGKLFQLVTDSRLNLDGAHRYRRLRPHVESLDSLWKTQVVDLVFHNDGNWFVVDSLAFADMKDYIHLGILVKGCYAYNVPRFLTVFTAAPLLVTSIMFVMTLYKCGMTLLRSDHRVMPVWKLFLRDGVVWFLAVFLAGGAELLIWTSRRESLKQLLIVPALVVYSIVSSRALLNIKEIASRESAELQRNDLTLESGNPIVFASA